MNLLKVPVVAMLRHWLTAFFSQDWIHITFSSSGLNVSTGAHSFCRVAI